MHIPRHNLDDDEASMCSEPGEESAFNEPPVLQAGRKSSICRLHPAAQLAGVRREGRSCPAFDPVARPLVLGPVLNFVGRSRLFWVTLRRVESLREHNDVSELI